MCISQKFQLTRWRYEWFFSSQCCNASFKSGNFRPINANQCTYFSPLFHIGLVNAALICLLFAGVDSSGQNLVIAPVIDGKILPLDRLNLSWPAGKPLNLTCKHLVSVKDAQPSSEDFVWTLPLGERRNGSFIEIESTQKSNSGSYRCENSNASTHLNIDVCKSMKLVRNSIDKSLFSVSPEERRTCGKGFFQCTNELSKICIKLRYVCDGLPDCRDGSDESEEQCGYDDPCDAKLPCPDGRCMDPELCCDPSIDTNCTVIHPCCEPLLESRYFQYGYNRNHELRILHSTIYTIVGT